MKPLYDAEVKRGNLEIVDIVDAPSKPGGGEEINSANFDIAIISSHNDFYQRMKLLEARGFSREKVINGEIFRVPNLDFPRLLKEGIAYGSKTTNTLCFDECSSINYLRVYEMKFWSWNKITFSVGSKSYMANTSVLGNGTISMGKFCAVAGGVKFKVGLSNWHDYRNVSSYAPTEFDGSVPREFFPQKRTCQILIGNDVWIGSGAIFNCANRYKSLVIGDGAVIASDSVVVKNVPPYAIVGGNPAQVIKYRFEPHIIEALLRIKWWDWSLDKINDNFKYFNDVEKFISLHDRS